MLVLAVMTAVMVMFGVLSPFLMGQGGRLAAGSTESSLAKLEAQKQQILNRFIQDEQSYQKKEIGSKAWSDRQRFLINRYIDVARRMDYLRFVEQKDGAAS